MDIQFDPDMDNEFDPTIFLKIGQMLCSEEYIYYGGLIFQEDIDRYNRDKEEENKNKIDTKNKIKNLIITGINEYKNKIDTKNRIKKIIFDAVQEHNKKLQNTFLNNEIDNLKNEIKKLKNKNNYLINNNEINNYVSEKYKIYEETIIKLIILKDELEQQLN